LGKIDGHWEWSLPKPDILINLSVSNTHCMKKFSIACLAYLCFILPLKAQIVNFSSSNLPIVVINTHGVSIPDDPKITADLGIIYNGPGMRNNLTDSFNNYNGKIGIETRGHSSQMFPMKSYGLELHDTAGNSINKSILNMPKESDWVMYAPYTDKTLMRNFLAYTLSQQTGHWAARCQFVEVVLNGNYIGVYVFMEKIKRNANRVNIVKMDKTSTTGDEVTGGYIFSLDKEPNAWISKFPAPNNSQSIIHYSYVYPKVEDIVPEQKTYIQSYVDSFETVLAANNFADTNNGYRKFIDVNSFMDYFFVNEVSRNVDGYRLSSYFYKDRNSKNSKIIAGPVWDYDLAFRNADYCNGSNVDGWAYEFNNVCPGDGAGLVPFWWNSFMKDTAYTNQLRCRWKTFRQTVFSEANIYHLVDSIYDLVGEAQQRHFQQWPVLGEYIWPNPQPIPTSYSGEIDALKNWIHQRLDWMDNNMPNNGACADALPGADNIEIKITPNPFSSELKIQVNSKTNQSVTIRVVDMIGRSMLTKDFNISLGHNDLIIPSTNWIKGFYVVRFSFTDGDKTVRKVLKN
jgi:hypothetical protein